MLGPDKRWRGYSATMGIEALTNVTKDDQNEVGGAQVGMGPGGQVMQETPR